MNGFPLGFVIDGIAPAIQDFCVGFSFDSLTPPAIQDFCVGFSFSPSVEPTIQDFIVNYGFE